jgi:hypothetical protein
MRNANGNRGRRQKSDLENALGDKPICVTRRWAFAKGTNSQDYISQLIFIKKKVSKIEIALLPFSEAFSLVMIFYYFKNGP